MGGLCGVGVIFVDGEVDFHSLEFRGTALSHLLALYKRLNTHSRTTGT